MIALAPGTVLIVSRGRRLAEEDLSRAALQTRMGARSFEEIERNLVAGG